ncbi:MAG: PA3496 family putative envelope integrity protein [Legionella sp.]
MDVEAEAAEVVSRDLDARRRLENMLDEKRLRDELDDFGDY